MERMLSRQFGSCLWLAGGFLVALGGCESMRPPLESGGDLGTGNVQSGGTTSLVVHSELWCGVYTLDGRRRLGEVANLHREIIDLPQNGLAPVTPGTLSLPPGSYKLRVEEGSRRIEWTVKLEENRISEVDVDQLLRDLKEK